jgi:uncharacterized membrane protein YphA (DoxX/SURF4 family)
MLTPGRILLSVALLGFGSLCLLYVDFVNSLEPVPSWIPAYEVLAVVNGLMLVAAGVFILLGLRTGAAAGMVAVFLALWIVLLHVPSAFTNPILLRSPWWIRTIRIGRIAFGVSMPVFGTLHLIYPESTASLVPPWYPWPMFWAYFTGLAQIAGGAAIAIGILPRLAAILAGTMYGTWALTLHIPRIWCRLYGPCEFLDAPVGLETSRGGLTSLFVVIGMSGAAWIVAGALARFRVLHGEPFTADPRPTARSPHE